MTILRTRYSRKLSPIERLSLVLNEFCNYNVDAIVEGHGSLSVDILRRAVQKAAEANPGSRVRLRGFLGFSHWVDSGIAPEVHEVHAPDWDGRGNRGAAFLEQRFDPLAGGPICSVFYLPGNPARIVFRTLHAAIDGRSMMHWMAEVFRALRDEPLLGSPCTYTEWDIMRKFQDKVNREGLDAQTELAIPIISCSQPLETELRYLWRSVVFPKIITNPLPKFALFLAEYARRNATGWVNLTVPVDLRSLREEVLSLGNLTSYLSIPIAHGDTTRHFTRRLSLHTRNYIDCYWPNSLKALPWVPVRTLRRKLGLLKHTLYEPVAGGASGGVVSMGTLELPSTPQFTPTKVIPIPGFAGKLNLVTVASGEHTVASFAVPESYNQDGQFDALLTAFQKRFAETPLTERRPVSEAVE